MFVFLDTWLWSNDIPLKETPVLRFWANNNGDILAYDCGILWFAKNTSVITPAPCVEQALRPYVCKQSEFYEQSKKIFLFVLFILAIDRCYNKSGNCGKYGTCINLPLTSSYKCQCRFLYTGDRCEKCTFTEFHLFLTFSSGWLKTLILNYYDINLIFKEYFYHVVAEPGFQSS